MKRFAVRSAKYIDDIARAAEADGVVEVEIDGEAERIVPLLLAEKGLVVEPLEGRLLVYSPQSFLPAWSELPAASRVIADDETLRVLYTLAVPEEVLLVEDRGELREAIRGAAPEAALVTVEPLESPVQFHLIVAEGRIRACVLETPAGFVPGLPCLYALLRAPPAKVLIASIYLDTL